MGSGCIFTKTTKGKESFFLVKDAIETVNDYNFKEENEDEGNDSFLNYLDNFKTPEKDSVSEHSPRGNIPSALSLTALVNS